MPEKFGNSDYDLMITPLDEEGNRTKNDPATANSPIIEPNDPLGIAHGLDRKGSSTKDGKLPRRS